ncbi:MAG: hypothetical protein ACK2TV_08710 [Anaerolineales bacterium]
MIKKIFVGVLMAGIFGLLVFGAINRTIAKSADTEQLDKNQNLNQSLNQSKGIGTGNGGEGQGLNQKANAGAGISDCGEDGQGNRGNNVGNQNTGNNASGTNGNGNRGGNSTGENSVQGQGGPSADGLRDGTQTGIADITAWEEPIIVTVDSVAEDLWLVSNAEGFELEIEGRTLSYLQENGLTASVGDELSLSGFYEGDDFEIGSVTNLSTELSLDVREASGRPLWAGGGRGGQ